MSATLSRSDLQAATPGLYRTRIYVYRPALGVSDRGGVIRNPAGMGFRQGVKPSATIAWTDRCMINAYSLMLGTAGTAPVEKVKFLLEMQWSRVRPYQAGMFIYVPSSGDGYYVDSWENVLQLNQKIQLTCSKAS